MPSGNAPVNTPFAYIPAAADAPGSACAAPGRAVRTYMADPKVPRVLPDERRANEAANRDERDRYRRAAEESLEQLQWCVGYLQRIRKPALARAVAKNCRTIRRSMPR